MPSFEIGDIVRARSGPLCVVFAFQGAPNGGRIAIIRNKTTMSSFGESGLTLEERPVFNPGDTITVHGVTGTVVEQTDDHHVHVRIEAYAQPLKGKNSVYPTDDTTNLWIEPGISRVPLWTAVLENKL